MPRRRPGRQPRPTATRRQAGSHRSARHRSPTDTALCTALWISRAAGRRPIERRFPEGEPASVPETKKRRHPILKTGRSGDPNRRGGPATTTAGHPIGARGHTRSPRTRRSGQPEQAPRPDATRRCRPRTRERHRRALPDLPPDRPPPVRRDPRTSGYNTRCSAHRSTATNTRRPAGTAPSTAGTAARERPTAGTRSGSRAGRFTARPRPDDPHPHYQARPPEPVLVSAGAAATEPRARPEAAACTR